MEFRKRLPAANHYTVYPETTHGGKGFGQQHATEDARGEQFAMAKGKGPKAFP